MSSRESGVALHSGKRSFCIAHICGLLRGDDKQPDRWIAEYRSGRRIPEEPEECPVSEIQLKWLTDSPQPTAVVIGIGGNDAGFGVIASECAYPNTEDCTDFRAYWLSHLAKEVPHKLPETYQGGSCCVDDGWLGSGTLRP